MFSSALRRETCLWAFIGLLGATRAALADESAAQQADPATPQQPREKASPDSAPAGSEGPPWRRFEFTFGASYVGINSELRLTKKGQLAGLSVDPEQVLGMSSEALSPVVWTALRFGDRHRIEFEYAGTYRSATETLSRDIVINGFTFPLNTTVHSIMDVEFFELGYVYSFYQDKQMDFGVSLGVEVVRTHFSIESQALVHIDNERTNVPIPLPGITYDYAFYPNFWIRQRVDLAYLSANHWSGLTSKVYMAFEWAFTDHVAVGLGATFVWSTARKESNSGTFGDLTGDVSYHSSGLLLYLNFFL
jgi:hypothetical protein